MKRWIPTLLLIALFFMLIAVSPAKADEVLFRCVNVEERLVRQFDDAGTPTGVIVPTWVISMVPFREPGTESLTLFGTFQLVTTDLAVGPQFEEGGVYAIAFDYLFYAPPIERLRPVQ